MYKLRCPKCRATASLPLYYTLISVGVGIELAERKPNVFCLACRHRWHTSLRFHPVS